MAGANVAMRLILFYTQGLSVSATLLFHAENSVSGTADLPLTYGCRCRNRLCGGLVIRQSKFESTVSVANPPIKEIG